MDVSILHIVVLALVQGITEFLPLSSYGHLRLVQMYIGTPEQGLILIVALHVGSLGAVMVYFWRDLWAMALGLAQLAKGRSGPNARLVVHVAVATIPVIFGGIAVNQYDPRGIQGLAVIAWATFGFGILLYVADKMGMTVRRVEHLRLIDAVIIGCAQSLALVPGTSRSGITMSAARMLGMERAEAARFSMLLSIPAILGAGILKSRDLFAMGDVQLSAAALTAAGLAFIAALVAITAMMAWLKRATFTPFVVYRLLLGGFLLALIYGWAG